MADDEALENHYRFTPSIDLYSVLEALEIEHLEVSPRRTIAIFSQSILNIEVSAGQLSDARMIRIEILDYPTGAATDPETRLERVADSLADATLADIQLSESNQMR
ncbi:hypothetical protein [Halopiger aswanensis]|uniref:Uncharacterized protein n=1 Tax=Halopiger aswanensis TaxID=148449 RepID=A0A419VUQ3_9EURY|nr:hypothetical protein [Halopiger aswanensis]RKD85229.1 hypothetical protein ATJ93_4732 [Halopiger aswanensis]